MYIDLSAPTITRHSHQRTRTSLPIPSIPNALVIPYIKLSDTVHIYSTTKLGPGRLINLHRCENRKKQPPMPTLVPVQGVARFGITHEDHANGYLTTSASNELPGAGHMGVGPLDRIIMSLRSGIESEIEYALNTLTYYSCNEPKILNFSTYPLMGEELIKYFVRPYHLLSAGKDVGQATLSISVESLLSLRNAVQDLHNQQWLCQVAHFRRQAGDALKFLVTWLTTPASKALLALARYSELFRESLNHLLDVLDAVTCFYVDTPKNDPMFHQLLVLLLSSSDKHILMVAIKCLTHLMYLGGASALAVKADSEGTPDTANCIDAVQPEHLLVVVRYLLVNDDELSYAALQFIKQYLFLEALHAQYPNSVKDSQLHRMRKLVQASSSKRSLHVLLKQLPEMVVARLPLVDPASTSRALPMQLARRSNNSGVPTVTCKLPEKLYEIVVTFPEPLRATTWLRCCYEPYTSSAKGTELADTTAGEVTQISLWKAYENQFEAIWKDRLNPSWPNLLPAVDFIKNVSSAFPNSEAMVVNIPVADPAQPARKKFIIKGIQPRQFPVSIELGNFEALRHTAPTEERATTTSGLREVDIAAFKEALASYTDSLLESSEDLTGPHDTTAPWYSPINALSRDILGRIITDLLEPDTDGEFKNVFRQYNKDWVPDLVFANPGLVEQSYFDSKWLLYLL